MTAAAGRQLVAQPAQGFGGLHQEVLTAVDEEAPGMIPPRLLDSMIELCRDEGGLRAQLVAVVVPERGRGRPQVNDGVVVGELGRSRATYLRQHLVRWARPIGETVQGSAIAERDRRWSVDARDQLELPLDVKDRALGRLSSGV